MGCTVTLARDDGGESAGTAGPADNWRLLDPTQSNRRVRRPRLQPPPETGSAETLETGSASSGTAHSNKDPAFLEEVQTFVLHVVAILQKPPCFTGKMLVTASGDPRNVFFFLSSYTTLASLRKAAAAGDPEVLLS